MCSLEFNIVSCIDFHWCLHHCMVADADFLGNFEG